MPRDYALSDCKRRGFRGRGGGRLAAAPSSIPNIRLVHASYNDEFSSTLHHRDRCREAASSREAVAIHDRSTGQANFLHICGFILQAQLHRQTQSCVGTENCLPIIVIPLLLPSFFLSPGMNFLLRFTKLPHLPRQRCHVALCIRIVHSFLRWEHCVVELWALEYRPSRFSSLYIYIF